MPGHFSKNLNSGARFRLTESETWGAGLSNLWFSKPHEWFWWAARFMRHFHKLILEFWNILWECSALYSGDLVYENSLERRQKQPPQGRGWSCCPSGWVFPPHQVPVRWHISVRGHWWLAGSSGRWESFCFFRPQNVWLLAEALDTDRDSNVGSTGLCWMSLHTFVSGHKLASPQTFYFENSQTYRKVKYSSTMHINTLFVQEIQLTLYHTCAGLFLSILHFVCINIFSPPRNHLEVSCRLHNTL